jgi:hypothetical protein
MQVSGPSWFVLLVRSAGAPAPDLAAVLAFIEAHNARLRAQRAVLAGGSVWRQPQDVVAHAESRRGRKG